MSELFLSSIRNSLVTVLYWAGAMGHVKLRFIIVILFSSKYCIFCVNLILELVFVVNSFFCSEHYHFTSHKVQDDCQLLNQLMDEDVYADMLMWALDRGCGGSSRSMTATASPPAMLRRGCSTWSRNAAIPSQLKKRLATLLADRVVAGPSCVWLLYHSPLLEVIVETLPCIILSTWKYSCPILVWQLVFYGSPCINS